MVNGFGMARTKAEGQAMHPDDMIGWTFEDYPDGMPDDYYERQLRAYFAWSGEGLDFCARQEIADKIKAENGE